MRQTAAGAEVDGIPIARYLGKGTHGTAAPKEELEAENRELGSFQWLGGWPGQRKPRPAITREQHHWWILRFWGRQTSTVFEKADCGTSAADTMLRGSDLMLSVAAAVVRATLRPGA